MPKRNPQKAGKPTKLTPEKIELALCMREQGASIERIAAALNICEQTFYAKGTIWAELRQQLNDIRAKQDAERIGKVEKALFSRAAGQKIKERKDNYDPDGNLTGYTVTTKQIPGDVKAQEFYLTNRAPERWQAMPESIVSPGENGGNIKIEIVTEDKPAENTP